MNGMNLYEYMDSWERFDKTPFPDKEALYSHLNMEDSTDYKYKKIVQKDY